MVTRMLERTTEEEAEFEWMHRDVAVRFLEVESNPGKAKSDAPSAFSDEKSGLWHRRNARIIIITASTQAAAFSMMCGQLESDTLVKTLDEQQLDGWTSSQRIKTLLGC
ncbi:hypothetical protein J1614_005955 [Plenodomus biglobosus]|nr:hypothetical protein J1614_005955 [Plenodomus biglobosus]